MLNSSKTDSTTAHNMCLGYPKRPRSLSNSIVGRSYAIRTFDFFSARTEQAKRTTGGLAAYRAPSQLAPIKPMRVGVTTEVVWTILTSWDPSCLLRASVMPDNDGPTAQLQLVHAACTMNLV